MRAPTTTGTGITLGADELASLTGYRRPAAQLEELHRRGFSRARRDRLGRVVLERAHYEAVCTQQQQEPKRPRVRPMPEAA